MKKRVSRPLVPSDKGRVSLPTIERVGSIDARFWTGVCMREWRCRLHCWRLPLRAVARVPINDAATATTIAGHPA